MTLQTGSQFIPQGAASINITFPVAFDGVPAVIVPVVRNLSTDDTKYLIEAGATQATSQGFTAYFDIAPNTGNYEICWTAGTAGSVMEAVAAFLGRPITSYNPFASMFGAGFKIPVIATQPRPAMRLLDQDTFWAAVVQRSPEVPASAVAGGRGPLSITVDNEWLYIGGPAGWGRIPVDFSTAWDSQAFYVPFREAEVAITPVEGQISYRIDFATPFGTGQIPKVLVELSDLSTNPKELLGRQITARDLNGFVITFTSPPPPDLKVYYLARQLPS